MRAFTVGQRRGLGVATGERRYVVDVDAATATVTLGRADELARDRGRGRRRRSFTGAPVAPGTRVEVQVRAHGAAQPGTWRGDHVAWDDAAAAVAPGQTVALYDGDRVLGAGDRGLRPRRGQSRRTGSRRAPARSSSRPLPSGVTRISPARTRDAAARAPAA